METHLLGEPAPTAPQGGIYTHLRIDLTNGEPIAPQLIRTLREAIVTARIKPGEMLSEQEVAKTLGVSRQPVREAFINLRDLGLIRVFPQRGTQVTKISVRAVEDARFIREAIECAIVRDAANKAEVLDIYRLRDSLTLQRQQVDRLDTKSFFFVDEDFHRLLASTARRPSAWDVVEMVKPQLDRVRFLVIDDFHTEQINVDEHARIVEAVESHAPDAAEQVMRSHLSRTSKMMLHLRESKPEMFEDA